MISVVVCAKDEAERIEACLSAVLDCADVGELIVVIAGDSDCPTAQAAREAVAESSVRRVIVCSTLGTLAQDRQLGADLAEGDWIAYIDADHLLQPGDLTSLVHDAREMSADVVQSRLRIRPDSFWNRAESSFLDMTHTTGVRDMVGVAPAVFRREVLQVVRFGATSGGGDDTDYMYRLHRDTDFRSAIGRTTITQVHAPRWRDYVAKWRWYGRGDLEFRRAHPERSCSMLFHLWVRYPLIHSARALFSLRLRAIPFCIAQGVTRATAR